MVFLGAVSVHDLQKFFDQPEIANKLIAADIMDRNFPRISPAQRMADALEKFSEVTSERLPVVDGPALRRLIGTISKTDIMLHLAGKKRSARR